MVMRRSMMVRWSMTMSWSTTWTRSGGSKLKFHSVGAHLQQMVGIECHLTVVSGEEGEWGSELSNKGEKKNLLMWSRDTDSE